MNKFKINDKCIGCNACARVAGNNFEMLNKKAIIIKQPDSKKELLLCEKAMDTCPTNAIIKEKSKLIVAESKVKETLEEHPFLKNELPKLSPKFKTMQNPVMWNTIAKYATFNNAAKMTGISICEILHFINKHLGIEKELMEVFPNCINEIQESIKINQKIAWEENYILEVNNQDELSEAINKIEKMKSGDSLVVLTELETAPLEKFIEELKYSFNIEHLKNKKKRISIYNKKKRSDIVLDVRIMERDPFDIIIETAYKTKSNESFVLVQTFFPQPMINMLDEMGFEYNIEKEEEGEVWIRFTKREEEESVLLNEDRPSFVIQSATPVGYPIIMRLLQSSKLKEVMKIKQLKVWEETEKHLAWIINGKADISFSAVITASKFKEMKVKMPAVFVWDNFSILTRGYVAESLDDIKGREIHMPLFEDAPPAKITQYLLKAKGYNSDEYKFKFGNPFGRPKQIMADFIMGKSDTVLLREPELSFAIQGIKNQGIKYSEIDYGKTWNEANEGFGIFPNAGVIVKEELYEKHPEIMKVFEEELKKAIDWVNGNKKEAAELSFDMMRNSANNVQAFIDRATFKYMSGEELAKKIEKFYKILVEHDVLNIDVDDELIEMFKQ